MSEIMRHVEDTISVAQATLKRGVWREPWERVIKNMEEIKKELAPKPAPVEATKTARPQKEKDNANA